MSEREMYVTSEGYKALEEELTFLKGARRQEVARRLHDALGEGELIENAELEDARREQSFVEGRIITLEEQLRNAVIPKAWWSLAALSPCKKTVRQRRNPTSS